MNALPGTKILVKGNHDLNSDGWFRARGFSFVAMGILTRGVWLTHAPQTNLPDGATINVHGHLHGDEHRTSETGPLPAHCRLLALEDPEVDYGPVELEKFVRVSPLLS
jgi:calcineurin-like phosphoesterase family protein